ncbi:hypothetical protein NUW54_g11346 [Trametes sanguinea]|uniref:Uncharacterized protein n=1 Tax=Trametes sanguinea TaxID=158606 RepID=A0ACC1NGN4_9APHY|nr:hypothetical protein NUW54_g11346 [Trametes sanguinea]
MFRYRDYIPLSTLADDDNESSHGKARNTHGKRRRIVQVAALLSVALNLYLFWSWYATWPLPLDNYQALNTHPIVDTSALSNVPPANRHDHAVVTGLYTDAFATAVATLGHTLNVANSSASRILYYIPDKISQRALCIASVSGWEPSAKPKTVAKVSVTSAIVSTVDCCLKLRHSVVTLEVKPWDDETDMAKLEESVRSIEMPGLVWGASKLVPIGYGIRKLQITLVVEDELVSLDELQEKVAEFDDYVQSSDVAAMQKL